jgi:exopolysaccharide production protein ExoQ
VSAPASRTSAGSAPGFAVLAACAFIMPGLAVYAPLGLAPLLAVAAFVLLVVASNQVLAVACEVAPLAVLLVLLSLWATMSGTWSILPLHSFLEGLRLLALSAGGLIFLGAARALAPRQRRRLGMALVAGVALAVTLLLIEWASGAALARWVFARPGLTLTRFDRGTTVLVLALWPALIALGQRRILWTPLLGLAGAAAVLLLSSAAAGLALAMSVAAFVVAWRWPRLVAFLLAAALVLLAVAFPYALPDDRGVVAIHQQAPWIKYSGIHRLMIWRFTADRIAERPWLGWGMDASRELPGSHTDLAELYPQADMTPDATALPLHPHNAALQWRVELGPLGALLCLAIVGWGLRRVVRAPGRGRGARAGALAWATAALAIGMLSYGAWQAWWLSCLWLTAALYAALADAEAPAISS